MKIAVVDPVTNTEIEMHAEAQDYKGENAWKIVSAEHGTFIILDNEGHWEAAENRKLVPELVREIGVVLNSLLGYKSARKD